MNYIGRDEVIDYRNNENIINEIKEKLKENNLDIPDISIPNLIEDYDYLYTADHLYPYSIEELAEEFNKSIIKNCGVNISNNCKTISDIIHVSFQTELKRQLDENKRILKETLYINVKGEL